MMIRYKGQLYKRIDSPLRDNMKDAKEQWEKEQVEKAIKYFKARGIQAEKYLNGIDIPESGYQEALKYAHRTEGCYIQAPKSFSKKAYMYFS